MSEKLYHVRFSAPLMPPSVNSLYNVFRMGPKIEVKLKPEVLFFKSKLKTYVPPKQDWMNGSLFKVSISISSNVWYYKNGKLKKSDVQNMIKCIIDAVFEKFGEDDAQILEVNFKKIFGSKNSISVLVEKVSEESYKVDESNKEMSVVSKEV